MEKMRSGETFYDRNNTLRATYLPEGTLAIAMKAKAFRRFEGFQAKTERMDEEFVIQKYHKDTQAEMLIMNSLRKNILFNNYSEEQLYLVMKALKPRVTKKGEVLIKKGEEGYNFYVIQEGEFLFGKDQIYSSEYCFGELSLLFDSPRMLSVKSMGEGKVYYLERPVFQQILLNNMEQSEQEVINLLKNVDILKDFSHEKLKNVYQKGHIQVYNKDDLVVKKGSKSKFFYIILSGRVRVYNLEGDAMIPTDLGECEYFGESVINDNLRKANVKVVTNKVELLVIDKLLLQDMNILQKILKYDYKVLNSIFIFNILNEASKNRVKESLEVQACSRRTHPLLSLDERTVYMIKKGRAVTGDRELEPGSYINVFEIVEKLELVSDELVYYALDKDDFQDVFNNIANYETKVMNFVTQYDTQPAGILKFIVENQKAIELYDNKKKSSKYNKNFSDVKNLKPLCLLGSGGYGTVSLVKNSYDEKIYALKAVRIDRIMQKQAESNILSEKDVLLYCRHPFILKLYHTLKDFNNFYFIFEPVLGGDLFGFLYDQRDCLTCGQVPTMCDHNPRVTTNEAVFYLSCVVEAFDYLHRNSIVYRDLKPENLMIDSEGYLKVVDFGFAKKLTTARTYTLCGTIDYMAPEILLKTGHNRSVDCWAIGVLLFELLVGFPPFSRSRDQDKRNHSTIFRNITKIKYNHMSIKDEVARDFVMNVFIKDPVKRLGMEGHRLTEMKEHEFLKGMDWDELNNKKIPSPWTPDLRNDDDTRYFRSESGSDTSGSLPTYNESVPKSRKASLKKKDWYNEF